MNNQHDDKLINALYQHSQTDAPPAGLDKIVLEHALASHQIKSSKRPWLAADSVVLALPLIWLLTQNPELTPEADHPSEILVETESTSPIPVADEPELLTDQSDEPQPALAQPAPLGSMAEIQQVIEQENAISVTGKPVNRASLEANRKQLINELKGRKRPIKASTMGPLMALEYEQFNRYLERGQFELADELLSEMQDSFPDYDYEDMIYQLAEAEIKQNKQ